MTEPLRIGVVGTPGSWSTDVLCEAIRTRTGSCLLIDLRSIQFDSERGVVRLGDVDLCQLDGLVIKKIGKSYSPELLDRLEMLRFVEDSGVPCFSSPARILRLLNRLSCTVTLLQAGLPLPPTVVTESIDKAKAAVERFGRAVVKPLYSTKARGMRVVRAAQDDLEGTLREHQRRNRMFYVQQLIPHRGRDLAVVFLGDEHLGTYARVAGKDSWNTTIRAGGHYEAVVPSPEVLSLARRARALFGLDFTSVDVVETSEGPLLFEVSAFGGYRGLHDALGIKAAEQYADYVLERIKASAAAPRGLVRPA